MPQQNPRRRGERLTSQLTWTATWLLAYASALSTLWISLITVLWPLNIGLIMFFYASLDCVYDSTSIGSWFSGIGNGGSVRHFFGWYGFTPIGSWCYPGGWGMEFKDKGMLHCFRKVKYQQCFTTKFWS